MAQLTTNDIPRIARDAFYVGVGLGVIGFQKAQVQRVELTKTVRGQVGEAKDQLETLGSNAEELLEELRGSARDARTQVRAVVSRAA